MLLNTPVCNFGWQAPKFELKASNGKLYTFDDVMGDNGLLIAFICNHCPYVQAIITRLVSDANILEKQGAGVVAIMPNDYRKYPDDSPENMTIFSQQHQMTFPYLVDETQEVARVYDAVCTPDFFGLNSEGQLQYRGRLDDVKMADPTERKPELLEAMQMVLKTGKGPEAQTASMGCSIKWR